MSLTTFNDLFSEISLKWSSHRLKKRSVSARRDPRRNFLAFYYADVDDTHDLLTHLKNEAASCAKVHPPRVEVCVSNINSSDDVAFCKKGNEFVTSPHFTSGLIGVLPIENHELQNLTANNSVFLFKCRGNYDRYKPYVNCDECVVNISWLLSDFEKVDVIAGSSYVIEASAVYFWYAVSYSHVIIHRTRDQSNAGSSAAQTQEPNECSLSKRTAVSSNDRNGFAIGRERVKRVRVDGAPEASTGNSAAPERRKNVVRSVIDDEVHVMGSHVEDRRDDVRQELLELQRKCEMLQYQVWKYQEEIEVKKKELQQKQDEIEKQKEETDSQRRRIYALEKKIGKVREKKREARKKKKR